MTDLKTRAQDKVRAATNVRELATALNDIRDAVLDAREADSGSTVAVELDALVDMQTLPVWGEYDGSTVCVWSWDPTHTLESDNRGNLVACARE